MMASGSAITTFVPAVVVTSATSTATAVSSAASCAPSWTQQVLDQWPGVLLGYTVEKADSLVVWGWHTLYGPSGCG